MYFSWITIVLRQLHHQKIRQNTRKIDVKKKFDFRDIPLRPQFKFMIIMSKHYFYILTSFNKFLFKKY